jgi:A/G-specific adenine glycosylase
MAAARARAQSSTAGAGSITAKSVLPSFASRLIAWQRQHGRHDLPWQNTTDPYRIWLSEIMLQQTQVTAVLPYYERFLLAFPSLDALARAPLERVLELWSGLGYYSRARNLHRCAQRVMERFAGAFPRDVAVLCELPGIGRSTAAAIAAFAFGARAPILDGNVKRVLARHAGVHGFPGERKVEEQLWRIAEERLAGSDIEAYTQGLMDLGATVCTRTRPTCLLCPLAADCVALATDRIGELPAPRPKKATPRRAVTMLLLVRHESVLVERRPPTGIWGGLWSLPELPENSTAARYCATRFTAQVRAESPLAAIEHGFTHFHLTITPQPCAVLAWDTRAEEPGLLWLPLAEARTAALPAPIKKLLLGLRSTPPT